MTTRRRAGAPLNHDPEAITEARENAELSQQQLAEMCGWSAQLQCDIEAGRRNADKTKLRMIAAATNRTVASLKRRRETEPEQPPGGE